MDEKVRLMKMRLLEKLMADLEDYDAQNIPKRRQPVELPPLEDPEEDLEMAMNPEMEEEMEKPKVTVVEPEEEEEEEEMLPGFLRRVKREREAKKS